MPITLPSSARIAPPLAPACTVALVITRAADLPLPALLCTTCEECHFWMLDSSVIYTTEALIFCHTCFEEAASVRDDSGRLASCSMKSCIRCHHSVSGACYCQHGWYKCTIQSLHQPGQKACTLVMLPAVTDGCICRCGLNRAWPTTFTA